MIKTERNLEIPKFLDNSGLCSFRRCPAQYFFRYMLHLESPDPKPALDFGSAIHAALPHVQRGDLLKALETFKQSWTSSGNEPDEKRNIVTATKLLSEFHSRVQQGLVMYRVIEPPSTGVSPENSYSDQEFAFAVDLGTPLVFAGRVDAFSHETRDSSSFWCVEYKTTSELGSRFFASFELSSQIIGYSVASTILTGHEVKGAFLEAFRVSSANPTTMCYPITVLPHMKACFVETFRDTVSEMLHCCETGQWRQDTSGCSPYAMFGSHGYECPFALLCKHANWEDFLNAFQTSKWMPFKELGVGE